jgi:N-acetylneuraminate synthase
MTQARRCVVVAEVAQAHDGSLGCAHAFIDAIAAAGADAVKFQTHIAAAESTAAEPWRVRFSAQDQTRYDYWRRMEFTEEQWRGLKTHAEERGLLFVSSPFSHEAIDLLRRLDIRAWKVASGEVGNIPMLDKMIASGLPIILSSGMSGLEELDRAVRRVQTARNPLTVLQCTSMYPCPPEKVGVHLLTRFRERYGCAVGLSDHSGTIYPGLAAAALGAEMIETHVTLSREMFGPDQTSSVTTAELRQLVDGVRFIERMRVVSATKDEMTVETAPLRALFTRSLAPRFDLPSGTVLTSDHLALKKPGTGIPGERMAEVIGRRTRRALRVDELILESDLEDVT